MSLFHDVSDKNDITLCQIRRRKSEKMSQELYNNSSLPLNYSMHVAIAYVYGLMEVLEMIKCLVNLCCRWNWNGRLRYLRNP